jgi:hypothetical protein
MKALDNILLDLRPCPFSSAPSCVSIHVRLHVAHISVSQSSTPARNGTCRLRHPVAFGGCAWSHRRVAQTGEKLFMGQGCTVAPRDWGRLWSKYRTFMALDWSDSVLYFCSQNRTNFVLRGGKTRLFSSSTREIPCKVPQWPIAAACLSRPETKYPPPQSRRAIDHDDAVS